MALAPTDCFNEAAYAPEYPASVAFVLRKTRQLRAEIGSQIDAIEAELIPVSDGGLKTVAQLNAMAKSKNQVFHLADSGTLSVGGVAVRRGATVLWNGTSWVAIGSGEPDLSGVDIPGKGTSIGELKQIVKDLLAALGRT